MCLSLVNSFSCLCSLKTMVLSCAQGLGIWEGRSHTCSCSKVCWYPSKWWSSLKNLFPFYTSASLKHISLYRRHILSISEMFPSVSVFIFKKKKFSKVTHNPAAMHSNKSTFPLSSTLVLVLPVGVRRTGCLSVTGFAGTKINKKKIFKIVF